MRKLVALTFMTLDGVIQGPGSADEDTSNGFTQGGWASDYWEAMMQQVMAEAMAEPYDIVLGRKTYDIFAAHWPNVGPENPVASIMNNSRKYVPTASDKKLEWHNSVALNGDIQAEFSKLKQQDGPLLQIHGSGQLIQTLMKHHLIDELRLWTFPVTVGGGKRLFESGSLPARFQLVKTEPCSNGVIMAIYRVQA